MADQLTDGDSGDQETGRPAPAGLTRDQYHDRERAAFLAEVVGEVEEPEADAEKPAPAKPAKKPAAAPTPDDDEDDDEDSETPVSDEPADDDEDDEDDEDQDDEDEPDADADPDTAKRLATVRRTEQRQRERLDRERADFARERSEWQAQTAKIAEAQQRFEALAARVKHDPYSVLVALGFPDDDMEYAGQQIYARSKAAAAKPEYRAAADRAMREREASDDLKKTQAELAAVKKSLEERDQRAAGERELEVYLGRVLRKADDTTPITKALIAKSPTKARAALTATAFELAQKLGQPPKAKQVLAAHERKEQRALRDRGIELPAAGAAPSRAKPGAASAKPGAKPSSKAAPKNSIPTRDEMIAEMEELDRASRSADN